MNVVSRFEANLLRILQFFLRRLPAEQAMPLVVAGLKEPPCLNRTAVGLVQDTLAKGCTLLLARAGGWRRERFLRGDKAKEERLWKRTPPQELGLPFSRQAMVFLRWVTAVDAKKAKDFPWKPDVKKFTVGDLLLLFYAYSALREADALKPLELSQHPAFAQHGLCRLAFPKDFGPLKTDATHFSPWTSGSGSFILEALQPELMSRWREIESGKENLADFDSMRALGQSQERILGVFLEAAEAAGRRDLARFLLQAAVDLLKPDANPQMWVGGLQTVPGQRLADRVETYQAALAFLRQLDRLRAWTNRARATGYFDEGYAAGQLWLADWERYDGDALHARAQAIIRHLDPLRQTEGRHEPSLSHPRSREPEARDQSP